MMRTVLLTRESAYQIYCANVLFRQGLLTDVFVEEGMSFAANDKKAWLRKVRMLLRFPFEPVKTILRIRNAVNFPKYFGDQPYHHQRIFANGYRSFDQGLTVHRVSNINDGNARDILSKIKPDFIYVFGTRMIGRDVLNILKCPVINMHWGWSPDYRAEGIVTALAYGGTKDLGVTVHHVDPTSDGGDIIGQARPVLDREDNFYSIGLRLTLLGVEFFEEAIRGFLDSRGMPRKKQDLSKGMLYSQAYMRAHPGLYSLAWRRLNKDLGRSP